MMREVRNIEAEAADWLSLSRSGQMTADDLRRVETWLAADPAHAEAYRSMQETWGLFGDIEDDPAVLEVREWALRSYNHAARARIAAAVGACAVLAGGWAAWWSMTPAPLPEEVVAAATEAPEQEFRTGVGQTTTATLFDGSVVTLDTNSVLTASEVAGIRLVELKKGRAFFKVAKDKNRPFKVLAAGRTVTATGTAFSVRADRALYQVTLVEGSVTVESPRRRFLPGRAADLRPGQSLEAEDEGGWRVASVDVTADTSWRAGRLTFQDKPLDEAAAEMNRYSKRKVVVAPEIAETPILGVFPTGDVEAFARAAQATRIATITFSDDSRIELGSPAKNSASADVHNASGLPSS